jgi:predicted site-specific integrase-resolvase
MAYDYKMAFYELQGLYLSIVSQFEKAKFENMLQMMNDIEDKLYGETNCKKVKFDKNISSIYI